MGCIAWYSTAQVRMAGGLKVVPVRGWQVSKLGYGTYSTVQPRVLLVGLKVCLSESDRCPDSLYSTVQNSTV